MYRQGRNCHGSGVATQVYKRLQSYPLFDIQERYVQAGLEVTTVEVCQRRPPSIIIIGIYRPPQSRPQWFDTFNDLTLELLNRGKLIITGDLNADILHLLTQLAKVLLDSLALAGTRPTSAPTRVTQTTALCIDIIAVNEDFEINRLEVIVTASSDHYPVNTAITFSQPDKVEPIVKRSFNKVDFAQLSNMVEEIDISTYDQSSHESLLHQWQNSFIDIIDMVAPIKTFPMRRHCSPFLTGEIRDLIRCRDYLAKQFKKNSTSSTLKQDLNMAQRRVKSRIRQEAKDQAELAMTISNPIFCRYSADMEENANKLHFCRL